MPIKKKGILGRNNGMKEYWTVANKKPRPVFFPFFHNYKKNKPKKGEKVP
jgi:hypothetical protein